MDQQKGAFRAFLLAALRNFLADARDRQHALKRGGDLCFVSLDDGQAAAVENLFQTCQETPFAATEDQQFERQWAQTLVGTALDRLAENAARRAGRRFSVNWRCSSKAAARRRRRMMFWPRAWESLRRPSAATSRG